MTRILLAVNDHRLADDLLGLISESDELEVATTLRDPQELRGALPRHDVDAVILHDRRGSLPLIEITRELTAAHPDLGLVLVVSESSPELLRNGMQAGARDVIAEPIGLEQLETSVLAAAGWTHALRRRAARDAHGELHGMGRVVTIAGAKGGVGTTTIAVHLALAARELQQASVCLVEYDLQAGDLRAFLDLPYRRSVVDLTAVAEELGTRHLQETLYTHASGMKVLLAPEQGEQAEEVTAAAARNILTAIRTREDLTVVDAGATLNDANAIAVEMADTVLIVATPDVVSLRGVSRLCALWDRLKVNPPEIAVLLNRTSRRLEVPPDLARRVVPVPVLQTTVPADFFALESAVNTGIPATDAASVALLRPMASVLGEISALPPKAERGSVSRAKRIAARFAGESGQVTVEFAGLLPLLLVTLVLVWQMVLVGMTYVFASHAARAGARALAVSDDASPAAVKDLPTAWRGDTVVSPSTNGDGYGSVEVKVKLPVLIPGLLDLPVTINSSAGTVIEDQLLQAESGGIIGSGFVAFGSGRDPIPGFTVGVEDAGVDACATPGQPIFAPAPSTLVGVIYNWYSGQPLLLFKFNPPLPGTPYGDQYWYVAEQITPVTEQHGTPFLAHQAVATFAASGSCIEIGWGWPNGHGTLASQVGGSSAHAATTPWGASFKQYFGIP
ncbi:MAG: AAA family ATPase [Solirubrobacterales bacterium]|nr:AAA family ATPase [Solirubrobacterales bacterium]